MLCDAVFCSCCQCCSCFHTLLMLLMLYFDVLVVLWCITIKEHVICWLILLMLCHNVQIKPTYIMIVGTWDIMAHVAYVVLLCSSCIMMPNDGRTWVLLTHIACVVPCCSSYTYMHCYYWNMRYVDSYCLCCAILFKLPLNALWLSEHEMY